MNEKTDQEIQTETRLKGLMFGLGFEPGSKNWIHKTGKYEFRPEANGCGYFFRWEERNRRLYFENLPALQSYLLRFLIAGSSV